MSCVWPYAGRTKSTFVRYSLSGVHHTPLAASSVSAAIAATGLTSVLPQAQVLHFIYCCVFFYLYNGSWPWSSCIEGHNGPFKVVFHYIQSQSNINHPVFVSNI
jgi:hypothetical protein